MTQNEYVTGTVKLLGLVILLFGIINTANAIVAAGAIFYSKSVMSNPRTTSSEEDFEAQLKRQMSAAEMGSRGNIHLMRLPLTLIQIGFGIYLCRREQRIVQFLLKP